MRADYVSVTTTLYSDMTSRVVDAEAFRMPDDCRQLTGFDYVLHEMSPNKKLELLHQLRRRHTAAATSLSTCFSVRM